MAEPALKQPQEVIVYFAMDDLYESTIAKEWVKKHANGALLMTRLPLNKLNASITVVPLVRKETRSPVEVTEIDRQTGRQKIVRTPAKELIQEISVCSAIKVADHWRGTRDHFGALTGDVDVPSFHNAMATVVSPLKAEIPEGTPDQMVLVFL